MVPVLAAAVSLYTVWTTTQRSGGLAAEVTTDPVADEARLLLKEGQRVFRYQFMGLTSPKGISLHSLVDRCAMHTENGGRVRFVPADGGQPIDLMARGGVNPRLRHCSNRQRRTNGRKRFCLLLPNTACAIAPRAPREPRQHGTCSTVNTSQGSHVSRLRSDGASRLQRISPCGRGRSHAHE